MAKKKLTIDDDFNLDSTMEIEDSQEKSIPETGLTDFSEFESGIESITFESEEYVKALIYGPNGTGKTTIAGTFPNAILFDVNEHGTKPLATKDGKVKKRVIDTFEMLVQGYWYLKLGDHPYKTVIIDNVTTLQEAAMKYVMNKEASFELSKDMDMPSKRDWGGTSQLMKRWMIEFRNLPMHVVFIAQEKRDREEDLESDEASVYPQVMPSIKGILGAAVDVIGRTYVTERTVVNNDTGKKTVTNNFAMRVTPSSIYLAKIRLPKEAISPSAISNPSYSKLVKIMNGEYKKGEK